MLQDLSELKQPYYEEVFYLEGNMGCDIDLKRCNERCICMCEGDELILEDCQEEMEDEILMKRETINNHQNRIDNQIILPRSLNTGHPKVTNEGISQPIFIKRMAASPSSIHDKSSHQKRSTNDESVQPPSLIKRMAVGNENIVTHNGKPAMMLPRRETRSVAEDVKMVRRMAIGNEMRRAPHDFKITMRRRQYNSSPTLVKRKHVDREKSFNLNHPDGIVHKRDVKNDEKQIKMVKRTAIGTEMKHVSDEHWSMPHRRENLDNPNAEPVHLIKRMAL
jgi:hypothetical protein